jgi:hypothetical protein
MPPIICFPMLLKLNVLDVYAKFCPNCVVNLCVWSIVELGPLETLKTLCCLQQVEFVVVVLQH